MPLLTSDDLRHHSRFAWLCMAALVGVIAWFLAIGRQGAAEGTIAAMIGCLGLILPPRERMQVLPWRVRMLPRSLDAAPVLATLLSSPGYGLNWFYGANPYDETVHLLSGALAGLVFAGLLQADGRRRGAGQLALLGAAFGLVLGAGWEAFEWAAGLIGDAQDSWTDLALTTAGAVPATVWWGRSPPAARPRTREAAGG